MTHPVQFLVCNFIQPRRKLLTEAWTSSCLSMRTGIAEAQPTFLFWPAISILAHHSVSRFLFTVGQHGFTYGRETVRPGQRRAPFCDGEQQKRLRECSSDAATP